MIKAIEIAKKIVKNLEADYREDLEAVNLLSLFLPIFKLSYIRKLSMSNAIIAYIVFAYDNDSTWLNIQQDREANKIRIASSLDVIASENPFLNIIENGDEKVNDVIATYLEEQTTWKWRHIFHTLDNHQKIMRFVNQRTEQEKIVEVADKDGGKQSLKEEYGEDVIAKIYKQKNDLLQQGLALRKEADILLSEIRKEFMPMETAVQSDFGFSITDEKKIDRTKWRHFIKHIAVPAMQQRKQSH